jgi:peroxiredoxin
MKNLIILLSFFLFHSIAQGQEVPKLPNDVSPLLIGEELPDVELADINGSNIALKDVTKKKPTVLIFYRGGWCPYCNLHLSELQTIETDILKLGYQIVAVSPDSPKNLKASVSKNQLNYTLLSDASTAVASKLGIAYQAPEKSVDMLKKSSDNLNSGILPVPALFVLNTKGEILFEYINPNYKKRIKGDLLLAVLNALKTDLE